MKSRRCVRCVGRFHDSASPMFHHMRRHTIPHPRPPWSAADQASPSPGRSPARIAASCSWTKPRNSPHGRCRRFVNRWNPGVSPCPGPKAPLGIPPGSSWSWPPIRARAGTPLATASAARAGNATVSAIFQGCLARFSIASTSKWKSRPSMKSRSAIRVQTARTVRPCALRSAKPAIVRRNGSRGTAGHAMRRRTACGCGSIRHGKPLNWSIAPWIPGG